jgi:hypothetical protein
MKDAIETGHRYIQRHREMCSKATEYAFIRNSDTNERIEWADVTAPSLFGNVDL